MIQTFEKKGVEDELASIFSLEDEPTSKDTGAVQALPQTSDDPDRGIFFISPEVPIPKNPKYTVSPPCSSTKFPVQI